MSEYAEIINDKVNQVLVMNDEWTHEDTIIWLHANVSQNLWIRTSELTRKAGKGDEYHADLQLFTRPKPFNSWELDVDRGIYLPPIPKPIAIVVGYVYKWSEDVKNWVLERISND